PAGWIPQGGGRPLLWRFFGGFLIAEKATLRSKLPGWQGCAGNLERDKPLVACGASSPDSGAHLESGASPPGALVFTRAMVEGPLSQKRRKRAVAGTACNSPQMSVITGTAWTQTAPRRCGQ